MRAKKAALLLILGLGVAMPSRGQDAQSVSQVREPLLAHPTDRISGEINEARRMALVGQHHPLAKPEYEIGEVPGEQPMSRMVLVLNPDANQQAALEELLRGQQDPESPYYRQWLTPEDFGERFGVSSNDLERVVGWLEKHGMEVEEIPASRQTIVFSGTATQVEETFHTSMKKYLAAGELHYANATDPEIPQALAGVVQGVLSLHDFRSVASHTETKPAYTAGVGAYYLAPRDWDTIYDVLPLSSQSLDGTGQSIAVLGRVDISLSDVRTFRSKFGLPANDPQIIVNGSDPGDPDCSDEAESALDVEWAGAIAQKATVKFVTSASTSSDGVSLSAQYAVNHNVAPIVSLSYGLCEAALGSGGNAFWNSLWSQAATQGMSVFVASGDSGAAGCDATSETKATQGTGVNGLCSSPYSTCVGGTEFSYSANPGAYWSATNNSNGGSALSYIPEVAWNDSSWAGALDASGGGKSIVYSKPSWQSAPGVPADGKRDVPDVALAASVVNPYIIQVQGSPFYVGGTSAATPSMASVMALVLQDKKASQGNANPTLYKLATQQYSAGGTAVFHDITGGNNSVPGVTGFSAGTGYDLVTGLGSVDADLFVNQWNGVTATNFAIAPSASSVTVGQGSSSPVTLTLSAYGGFNTPVTLSANGLPAGVTVTFSPQTLTAKTPVTATFSASSSAAVGSYSVVISGTGSGLTRTTTLSLSVVAPSFTLTAGGTSVSVNAGGSIPLTVTTAAVNGFKSAIALSVSGLPQGVTAAFSPTSIASPGSGSSTLTITASSSAAASSSTLTVTATGGGVTKTQAVSLSVVLPPSFTLTPSASSASVTVSGSTSLTFSTNAVNGFKSAVALSVSGLPKGVTASFSPASIASPGTGSSKLTLTASSSATASTSGSSLTITASGAGVVKTVGISLTVQPAPSMALAASPTTASVAPGSSTSVTVTTSALYGFSSAVALSVSGLPKGVTASFSPTSIASPGNGSSKLTLTASSSTVSGTCTLTVSATGGGLTETQTISLTVSKASH